MKPDPSSPVASGEGRAGPGCNVNSTFNYTVGVLAVAVAILIGYWVYTTVLR
jgi:hypothetical protein